jgi:hypothetical protein
MENVPLRLVPVLSRCRAGVEALTATQSQGHTIKSKGSYLLTDIDIV